MLNKFKKGQKYIWRKENREGLNLDSFISEEIIIIEGLLKKTNKVKMYNATKNYRFNLQIDENKKYEDFILIEE